MPTRFPFVAFLFLINGFDETGATLLNGCALIIASPEGKMMFGEISSTPRALQPLAVIKRSTELITVFCSEKGCGGVP